MGSLVRKSFLNEKCLQRLCTKRQQLCFLKQSDRTAWREKCHARCRQGIFLLTGQGATNAPNTSAAGPHPSPFPEEEGAKPAAWSVSAKTLWRVQALQWQKPAHRACNGADALRAGAENHGKDGEREMLECRREAGTTAAAAPSVTAAAALHRATQISGCRLRVVPWRGRLFTWRPCRSRARWCCPRHRPPAARRARPVPHPRAGQRLCRLH